MHSSPSTSTTSAKCCRPPEVLWAVVRILARRLRATDEALADAMFLDVTGRTAKRLLELAGDESSASPLATQKMLRPGHRREEAGGVQVNGVGSGPRPLA